MPSDLARVLLETTLATSAAILLVLLLRAPLRRLGGWRAAYAIWMLVPAAWLAVLLPAPIRYVVAAAPVRQDWTAAAVPASPMPTLAAFDAWPIAMAVWLAGAAVLAWSFLREQRAFVRNLGALRACGDGLLQAQACAGLPAVVGLRHRVVVPADFYTRYRAREQVLILAHERVHARRGDMIGNACAALFRCLYWFNPLMSYAAVRFRRDQELACDEAVVAKYPQARRAYGEAMLKTQLSAFPAPLACHWYGQHPLMERIVMLKQPIANSRRGRAGLAVAVSVTLLGTVAAWAAQPATVVVAGTTATATAQKQKPGLISLDVRDQPVKAFAAQIAAQAGLRLRNPEVLGDKRISVMLERMSAETVFQLIGEETGFEAKIENGEVRFVPARTAPKPSASAAGGAQPIDLRMKLSVGGVVSEPRIVSRSGESFMIRYDGTKPGREALAAMTLFGTATVLADGKIAVETEIRRDGEVVGKPTLHLVDGKPGSIVIDDAGRPAYRLEIDASARPERHGDVTLPPQAG